MAVTRVFLVLFSLFSLVLNIAGQICVPDTLGATAVMGNTVFTAAGTLTGATGVHIERTSGANQGKFWVVLSGNVVARYTTAYSLQSVAAPEFSFAATNGGTTNLNTPYDITTDSLGTCYLSDSMNHRVLMYSGCYAITLTTTGPTGVLGQASLTANTAGATAGTTLNTPKGLGFDSTIAGAPSATNPMFVVNAGFHEIVYFATGVTGTAVVTNSVQSFGTGAAAGATGTSDLSGPTGMAVGQAVDVMFIADAGNHRIMTVSGSRAATTASVGIALGTAGTSGCSATLLNTPKGVAYDITNNVLYIADSTNNRIVYASASAAGVLATALTGQMFPAGGVLTTCAAAGTTQNSASSPTDLDVVPAGSQAPSTAGGPTLVFSDTTNARGVKLCSGTVSGSITTTQAFASVSASFSVSSGAVAGVSPSFSASVGSGAGVSPSVSNSFGAAAGGTSPSFSASAAAASQSFSITVSLTASLSYSITVTITTSLTTSITTSITNSVTNSNSYSLSITNSVTNSYSNSYTNSNTNSYSNSYTNSHSISISKSIKLCGNGKIDGAEKCDDGKGNGKIHGCCRRNCRYKYGGHICKAPLGVQCYGKGRCDRAGKCRDLQIRAGKKCNVAGNVSGVKDGRCNINAVCVASA